MNEFSGENHRDQSWEEKKSFKYLLSMVLGFLVFSWPEDSTRLRKDE